MKLAVRDPVELSRLLDLPEKYAAAAKKAVSQFPLFAPREFVARMRPGDPADPLLRQVLPIEDETTDVPGFVSDPVGDEDAKRQPGLIHKYRGRALLIATGSCAIHCRYCFRRHFPYEETPRSLAGWEPAFAEIENDSSLTEIILSGGDPLTLVDSTLAAIVERLQSISHLRRLRIHTRLPIVIPQRVTGEFLRIIADSSLTPIVVLHANHANELDANVANGVAELAKTRTVLLNQAVLLRGVNDSAEAQTALCERLVELRVTPYYLHQLDRVAGAAHFEVPIAVGRRIIEELRTKLPGYAVPRYVQETLGATHKIVLE
jgi:EF-P beta-lysylation protein EpmB